MSRKTLNIGLFGFGCVGQGLYEVLEKTPTLNARIHRICVKDPNKQRSIAPEHFTFNPDDILTDPQINTVVELIDDADAAYKLVCKALRAGKSVVSANKKMIAEHFEELIQLQQETGSALLYEAAVCASIPIIRNLEEYYDNDLLELIEGIVNGSTNYILTRTDKDKISPQQALQQAQALGYAESNPIMDVGGFDAKFKLVLLLGHAFGTLVDPEEIFHLGIDRLGKLELDYAKEKSLKVKLVAVAKRHDNGKISALVMPKFVSPEDPLFGVDDVFNGVKTKTHFSDAQFFAGRGAGAYPTASAVISDISALSYDYKYEYKKRQFLTPATLNQRVAVKVLFRYQDLLQSFVVEQFIFVSETFHSESESYIIGTIDTDRLKRLLDNPLDQASAVLFQVQDDAILEQQTQKFKYSTLLN